jgi:hypothetical protein
MLYPPAAIVLPAQILLCSVPLNVRPAERGLTLKAIVGNNANCAKQVPLDSKCVLARKRRVAVVRLERFQVQDRLYARVVLPEQVLKKAVEIVSLAWQGLTLKLGVSA